MQPLGFQHLPGGTLRVFNQQVNDFGYCRGWEQCTDIVTALAEAHKKHLSQFTSFQNWKILPNGCDPSVFHEGKRDNKRLVFASSPDRGLHWLLELFPRLKKRVPDVEAHIYYNFQDNAVQIYTQLNEHEMANRFKYINLALAKLKDHGVFHHKNVSRQEIAKVFSESRILAYTCDPVRFTEGFSCTTLEGAVSGCLPVICGSDALGEIYGNFVPTTPPPYKDHRDHYFENLLKYLLDDEAYKQAQTKAKEMGKTHNWGAVAKHLQAILSL
jgi:glycosyltransferase involved in cell wall biosynthesis